ncbi:hypothetical protein F8165_20095 [Bacillus cereus]|uniref:Uncharacterized protein n=1 Tax=Bacillus cereus TaxID=1396 RepID=A0AAN5XMM4_BACCE|nr:hypothetical protein F8165_20095 [Bacillus cereus]KAB2484422.1 hypothetical protein F8157_23270 [Bacillus cereus]
MCFFVCLKKNYYSFFCIFNVIHKLYNQPHKKDMMCNMIHKNVTKCVGKNIYILGRKCMPINLRIYFTPNCKKKRHPFL